MVLILIWGGVLRVGLLIGRFPHGSMFEEVIVASLLFEQLSKVVLAVEDSIESSIGRWGEGTTPMRAPEAAFMIGLSFYSHLP